MTEDIDYDKLAEEAGDEALEWIDENMPPITKDSLKAIRERLPTDEDKAAWDKEMEAVNDVSNSNELNQALTKFAAAGTAGAVDIVKKALKAAA